MTNENWTALIVGLVLGASCGGYVGSRWRDWLAEGWEWLIAICAAVGVVCLIVGGIAWTNGWRP